MFQRVVDHEHYLLRFVLLQFQLHVLLSAWLHSRNCQNNRIKQITKKKTVAVKGSSSAGAQAFLIAPWSFPLQLWEMRCWLVGWKAGDSIQRSPHHTILLLLNPEAGNGAAETNPSTWLRYCGRDHNVTTLRSGVHGAEEAFLPLCAER